MPVDDTAFTGSIPATYDACLGPLLFEPYAKETARRVASLNPIDILEVAAGTGIVTESLHQAVPAAQIVATDLNGAMLAVAEQRVGRGTLRFQTADALSLPFEDGGFDVVVSQFGVMFYPDRVAGNAEAYRVLRPGGTYLTVVWDGLDRNPVSLRMSDTVKQMFPDNPPRFLERTPFGYHDRDLITRDLRAAGFANVEIEAVALHSRVDAARAAQGMCKGSPLSAEILDRDGDALNRVTDRVRQALAEFEGREMPMSALYVTAIK